MTKTEGGRREAAFGTKPGKDELGSFPNRKNQVKVYKSDANDETEADKVRVVVVKNEPSKPTIALSRFEVDDDERTKRMRGLKVANKNRLDSKLCVCVCV
jgi:hypothetical protein